MLHPIIRAEHNLRRRSFEAYDCAKALDPSYLSTVGTTSTHISIIEIFARDVMYSEYRDDPIFSALEFSHGKPRGRQYYHTNTTLPGIIGYSDETQLCDIARNACWYGVPPLYSLIYKPESETVDEGELVRTLLSAALKGSSIALPANNVVLPASALEAASHCNYFYCEGLPREQWKVEVRRWFGTSLARIQVNLLSFVRGLENHGEDYQNIPVNYRGICNLGKFQSVGWRNVSVWGLIGLLALAGAVCLASIRTEERVLWCHLGARALGRGFCWSYRRFRDIERILWWRKIQGLTQNFWETCKIVCKRIRLGL